MDAKEFLKSEGLIAKGKSDFIIKYPDGKEVSLVNLMNMFLNASLPSVEKIFKQYPPIIEVEVTQDAAMYLDEFRDELMRYMKQKELYKDCPVFVLLGEQSEIKLHSVLKEGFKEFQIIKKDLEKLMEKVKQKEDEKSKKSGELGKGNKSKGGSKNSSKGSEKDKGKQKREKVQDDKSDG
jgi:hypothetical protein